MTSSRTMRPGAVKTAAFTSGYGVRSDPFRGAAAMHAGIDLAEDLVEPWYAAYRAFAANRIDRVVVRREINVHNLIATLMCLNRLRWL